MATATFELVKRPAPTADYTARSRFRPVGITIGLLGLAFAVVALVGNLIAADDAEAGVLAWSFGVTTTAFAAAKIGIAVVLMGLIVRLWMRVESVKAALPRLKAPVAPEEVYVDHYGEIDTPFGKAVSSPKALGPLFVHRMARSLYGPMLFMGAMAVVGGLVLSIVQANVAAASTFETLSAWVQGLQFLGEAMLLGGISFLLGTILAALRTGGGEVQESLGSAVKTLRMPLSAKLFITLMMMGMMAAMAQFGLYLVAVYADVDTAAWFAWLAPLRELALGVLLAGIVLALFAIGTVLGFQFNRIKELIVSGR